MNLLDLILIGTLLLFGLRGLFRGFFRESFSLLAFSLGFILAVRYDEHVAGLWEGYWNISPAALKTITFVALFFIVYLVLNLVGLLLHNSAKFLFLRTVNRAGGVAIGVGKGAVLLSIILFFVSSSSWLPQKLKKNMDESYLVSPLRGLGFKLVQFSKTDFMKAEDAERQRARRLVGVVG